MQPPDLSAFGNIDILRPLTGGFRSDVWLAERNGMPLVAKSTTRSESQIIWMTELMQHAEQSGLRLPELIPSQNGNYICDGFTVETFLSGNLCPMGELPDMSTEIASFHQAARNLPQRPGFASCSDLLTQDLGGDVDMSALPDVLRQKIRHAFRAVAKQPIVPLHGDLGEINVLIADGQPPALIDWDESRMDCAFFDLQRLPGVSLSDAEQNACLAFEIATCWQSEPEYSQNLAQRLT